MESRGAPQCIHVNATTAALLGECGKHAWIQPRKDTIHAKGKGRMQTYWVDTRMIPTHPHGITTSPTRSKDRDFVVQPPSSKSDTAESWPIFTPSLQEASLVATAPPATSSSSSPSIPGDELESLQQKLPKRLST